MRHFSVRARALLSILLLTSFGLSFQGTASANNYSSSQSHSSPDQRYADYQRELAEYRRKYAEYRQAYDAWQKKMLQRGRSARPTETQVARLHNDERFQGYQSVAGTLGSVEKHLDDRDRNFLSEARRGRVVRLGANALDVEKLKAKFVPRIVPYRTKHPVGTIVVDRKKRYLYLVQANNKAVRYGIGIGRQGFSWEGDVDLSAKKKWPGWTPPAEMHERQPGLPKHMKGGPENPLGARALYLFKNGKDTLYRIHGTNEPWSIGSAASSGCIRMRNVDVIDLYERVKLGVKVVVI